MLRRLPLPGSLVRRGNVLWPCGGLAIMMCASTAVPSSGRIVPTVAARACTDRWRHYGA